MRVVLLLVPLLAGCMQVMAASCDHVVSAVGRRVPYRLVLAHKEYGDRRGDATKRTRIGTDIDKMPCARVCEAGLDSVKDLSIHVAINVFTLPTTCDMVGESLSGHEGLVYARQLVLKL